MILPIGDDNPKEKTPYVHYAIMIVNVLVFFHVAGFRSAAEYERFYRTWGLVPAAFNVVSLFTSMYLHAGLMHLAGNMLFLWIVGDNVEDRVGHVGYLVFYHAAGAVATLAHAWAYPASTMPLVGASGAISGMMGAYAVFFPHAKIKIWYWVWLFFTNVVYVSAKWAVALWFLEQLLLRWATGAAGSGVAYEAHIGGLVFGVATAAVLRETLLREQDTVRRIVRPRPAGGPTLQWVTDADGRRVFEAEVARPSAGDLPPQANDLKGLTSSLAEGDLRTAYRYFTRATSAAGGSAIDPATMMKLGGALVMTGQYGPAARVYEVVVETYPDASDTPEAAFRLGTILSRSFRDYTRARDFLVRAQQTHRDLARRRQIADELRRIDAYLRGSILRRRPNAPSDG